MMRVLSETCYVKNIDGRDVVEKICKVVVHSFTVGDVDDPDIYAAEPLHEWQHSEAGKWIIEHSVETPSWNKIIDYYSFGHRYTIVAHLRDVDLTYWKLKYE